MKKIILTVLFLFSFGSLCFGSIDFDPLIAYQITFDPSPDERVIGHNLYITNLNTNNIQKIDLEDEIIYIIPINTLNKDHRYKLTATAYGYLNEEFEAAGTLSESIHSEPFYMQNIAPVITDFLLQSPSNNFTVSIISLIATDNVGVTGYYKSQISTLPSEPSWLSTKPTNHVFSSSGNQTLYMWSRDAIGNISLRNNATTNITVPTCDTDWNLCETSEDCLNAGWNWCSGICQEELCPPTITHIISNGVIFNLNTGD